jgi:glycosyltransferase involved in cell wall biosynthesis
MEPKPYPRRIGVVDQSVAGWTAAATYSKMTLQSLRPPCEAAGSELYFLSAAEPKPNGAHWLKLAAPGRTRRGQARLRYALGLNHDSDPFSVARKHDIDVLLPLLDVPPWKLKTISIGWIPDFQHLHLPQFFDPPEMQKRDATIRRLVANATLIIVSSAAARNDLEAYAPEAATKARVSPFPSLLAFRDLTGSPEATRVKFNLPEKFALVANQFWAHKNHQLVVSALAKLRTQGISVPTVMTGLPVDHRDRDNRNLSALLQAIASAGLQRDISILGQVDYDDLINLMRMAAVIIQPSRFEGWSTVVQDAKALGRPLLCSDIDVHREQAPEALGFFGCDDPDRLAAQLTDRWPSLVAGPDEAAQAVALARELLFARAHGENLLSICAEAARSKNLNG